MSSLQHPALEVSRWARCVLCTIAVVTLAATAHAGHPPQERFNAYPVDKLLHVVNGSVTRVESKDGPVLRWKVSTGQTSLLSVRPEHPLFDRLRYYDAMDFEFRVAAGEVSGIDFSALGHVSGASLYKVHQWHVATRTTKRQVWHRRRLDLFRPNWYPWDNPDGKGGDFFHFSALGIAPGTVIELRGIRLARAQVLLKPDFRQPITWPIPTRNKDGSVTYESTFGVVNAAGRPITVEAQVLSEHQRFRVSIRNAKGDPTRSSRAAEVPLKNGRTALFAVEATIAAANIKATPELYAEPLRLSFQPKGQPNAACFWQGHLVRPLSETLKQQVVVSRTELQKIRQGLAANDAEIKKLIGLNAILRGADAFLKKELLHIPTAHQHPGSYYRSGWRPTDRMPEAVNSKTGEREFGTTVASHTWQMYFGYPGNALDHLGKAYLYTQDEKYARKAVELFRVYARQYPELLWGKPFGTVPWHRGPVLLAASRVAKTSTYGTNWYFTAHCRLLSMIAASPSWTDEDRERVYRQFVLPYATELIKFHGGINNMTDITNHNVLLLGIAFRDAHLVYWAVQRDSGVAGRLRDIDADGFSSEGRPLNYHFAGMREYLPSIAYLENSGLPIEYPRDELLAAIRMPYYRCSLTGAVPSSGDCGRGGGARRNRLADLLIPVFPKETWLYDAGGSPLRHHLAGRKLDAAAWRKLIDTKPRLFRHAGMAILRSGDTAETQVMATLDYGRNVMHAALDRNQITLAAFGKTFTHGPGSLYNAGSGGIVRSEDPRLRSFCSHGSLGQNVIMVDAKDQLQSIGELLAWSAKPDFQVAASRVPGIQPGVTHTRALVLTHGVVVLLDRVESDKEHTYDFVYHNFGKLALGNGWAGTPVKEPLATTANYENIVDVKQLAGKGAIRMEWDLTDQIHLRIREKRMKQKEPLPVARLALWQLPNAGGRVYTGSTGLNNPNTGHMPEAAPSIFHRVRAKTATFATVLEPHKGTPKVTGVQQATGTGITVAFADGQRVTVSLDAILKDHPVR